MSDALREAPVVRVVLDCGRRAPRAVLPEPAPDCRQAEIQRLRAAFGAESRHDPLRTRLLPCKPEAERRSVIINGKHGYDFYPECPGDSNTRLTALARLIEQM